MTNKNLISGTKAVGKFLGVSPQRAAAYMYGIDRILPDPIKSDITKYKNTYTQEQLIPYRNLLKINKKLEHVRAAALYIEKFLVLKDNYDRLKDEKVDLLAKIRNLEKIIRVEEKYPEEKKPQEDKEEEKKEEIEEIEILEIEHSTQNQVESPHLTLETNN